jgi:capsular polysaccharide biosynthesis protein
VRNLVNRSASSNLMDNLATHILASTRRRVLSLVLVDQVEIIRKIHSCSVQPSSPNILANGHHMFQVIIKITQVHQ